MLGRGLPEAESSLRRRRRLRTGRTRGEHPHLAAYPASSRPPRALPDPDSARPDSALPAGLKACPRSSQQARKPLYVVSRLWLFTTY
jgi:hypothetical protein